MIASVGWSDEVTETYYFTSKDWGAVISDHLTKGNWTSGKNGAGYSNGGIQVTTTASGANGTSPKSFNNVTKIVATYNTNKSKGAGSIEAKIGNNDAITNSVAYSGSSDGTSAKFTTEFNYDTPQSGNVKITVNTTTNSIYLCSVAITYDAGGSTPTLNSSDLALTGAPVELSFDLYNNKTAQTINYTTSSTGVVTVSASDYITTSVDEDNKTITVTPTAKTPSAQTITVNQAADDNYDAGTATFTVSIDDSTPFTSGEVTFVGGTDKGSTTANNSPDEVSKSVVTISSTDAAFATAQYRLYASSETTFSVPEGYYITKIIFTDADTKNPCSNLARKNGTAGEFDSETLTWTGASSTVVFVASAQARASQIVVTVATGTPKQSPTVEISATELEVNGDVATATVTTNGPAVTLSTSDPAVASVSGTTVTAVAAGTATITATWEENDTYVGGTKAFTVTVTDNTPVTTDWVKTDLSALTADDIFVIVGNNENDYALANDKGTSSAPTAVSVTVSGNYLTGTVADNIKWHVSGNATDGYTFYPNGSTTTWLYCTNTNNGVRVGSGEAKAFTQTTNSYLTTTQTTDQRYLGIYNSQDWRCYTSEGGNIANQTFAFYKYTGAPAPTITASDVEITYDATSGSISYTINNGVEGGTLAATTEADWLTIGNVSENVPFSTTANETAIARTADVVLTYTYGTSTTSKTITVTQVGNPNTPGTVNTPYTVAEALEVIEALADNGKTSDVYVKGTISSITEVSTEHGNATYFISDGTSELYVFRGYFLENAMFTAEDQIQVGDEVVVYGKLQKYVKDGNTTLEVTQGNYIVSLDRPEPVVEPGTPAAITAGFYTIKNLGNNQFVNVAGRKTVTFVDETATAPGTVIKVESNEDGQVQVLRSQGVDLPGYAERAMKYVPKIVQLVAEKLGAEGEGNLLGKDGLDAIMKKFNESFDYHLYTEQGEQGVRIYGKTPSMQPVVDFYNDNTANVDAKLPMLEDFINSAIRKVLDKTEGSGASILTEFSLHEIWEKMGKTLTEPVDADSKLAFLQDVLSNKQYVWDFAYQTAMKYWKPLISHEKVQQNLSELGDLAQYVEKIEYIRPDVKYYIVQKEGKIDFISQDNTLLKETSSEWKLAARKTFTVNFDEQNVQKEKYYTTLYTDFAYTLPEGVKAMTVTKVAELNGKNIAITETIEGAVPAQTPVLLESATAGNVELTLEVTDGTAIVNLLKGNDWLVNELEITTPQVDKLFGIVHDLLEYENMGSLYDRYVKEYEYLKKRNAGTVNNKYFFALSGDDIAEASATTNVCQFTKDEQGLAFSYNLEQSPANKAFLPGDKDLVYLSFVGDVNRDGKVSVADVNALVEIVLGKVTEANNTKNYDFEAAHVNADEDITIADVTALVNIILGK